MAVKSTKTQEVYQYVIIAAVVAMAIFSLYSWYQSSFSVGSSNYNYYQNKNAGSCGDLTDAGNVQHLSHHPSQYGECLKQVSPEMFQKAVRTDKDTFLRSNGIK